MTEKRIFAEKKNGKWWVVAEKDGKIVSERQASGEKSAMQIVQVAKDQLAKERERDMPTFREYATVWLVSYIKAFRRPSTHERYEGVLRQHVFPVIGSQAMDKISRGDIRNLFFDLANAGKSRTSIELVRDVISGPFKFAIDDEIITKNPVSGLLKRLNLNRGQKVSGNPLTRSEAVRFLESCEQLYPEHHTFFLCAFRTGMRLGELLALRWNDIEWRKKTIRVERSFRRGEVGETKNGKVRYVCMSEQVEKALRAHKLDQEKSGITGGIIFQRKGRMMPQNSVRRYFKRILKAAGLPDIRFHDVRHTYASLLASEGVGMYFIKEQLGHHSVKMTDAIYAHFVPNPGQQKIVNKLDD